MSNFWTGLLTGVVIATALVLWLFGHLIVGLILLGLKIVFVVGLLVVGLVVLIRRLIRGPSKPSRF